MSSIRAVFMGSDAFSLPTLEALLSRGSVLDPPVETVGVVTQPDRPAGRGRRERANPVKTLAGDRSVPVLQPERVRAPASLAEIVAVRPDLIVLVSFGQILPEALLRAPGYGAINLHPSLLPRFRGPSPVVETILAGEEETGITMMLMTPKMDAGPILSQERVRIGPRETAGELTDRLARLGANLLLRDLPLWLAGSIQPLPQEEEAATYTRLVRKEDGLIDWTRPAETIARRVRAYNPWPSAYTYFNSLLVRILEARASGGSGVPGSVLGMRDDALEVGTGEGTLLAERLQLAGGRPMSAAELIRGHRALLAARFSAAA